MDSASRRHYYSVQGKEETVSMGLLWNNAILNGVFQAETNENNEKNKVQVAAGVLNSGHRNNFDDFVRIFSGNNTRLFIDRSSTGEGSRTSSLRCKKGYRSSSSKGKGEKTSKSIKKLSKREIDQCNDNESSTSSSYRSKYHTPADPHIPTILLRPLLTPQPSPVSIPIPTIDPTFSPDDSVPSSVPTLLTSTGPSDQASGDPPSTPSSSPSSKPSAKDGPVGLPSSLPSTRPSVTNGCDQPRFDDYAIYFDDTIENPYSLRRYFNNDNGDGNVFYRSFGCREGSTTDLGMLFFNTENCQVECEFSLSRLWFQELCEQTPDRSIRFELPIGAFPTDTRFYVGNVATDFQLKCAQAVAMRSCANQNFDFFADYFDNNGDLQYIRVVPPETETGFSEVFSCKDAATAVNDGGVVQFNNDNCATECVGRVPLDRILAFCKENLGADFSLFIPGDYSSDSRVYVGILADNFELTCEQELTISVIASNAPSVAPSTLPSTSSNPSACNVPSLNDYSIYFEETVEDPFGRRTVPDVNDDDVYHRNFGCREGASTDIGMLFFDAVACRVECTYFLPAATYRDLCRQTPDRNIRFELPVGDYAPGTTFVVGYLSEASTLSCTEEVSLRSCSNQNFDFFSTFFATGDNTYRRVSPPQTEEGFYHRVSCRDLGDTDLGVVQFNNNLCSTDCLGFVPLSKVLKLCADDNGSDISLFIEGAFISDDRVYVGSLNYDVDPQCAAEFQVSVLDSSAPSLMPSSAPSVSSNPSRCFVPSFGDYSIYFDDRLDRPYRSRSVLSGDDDYVLGFPCQEGISNDFVVLYFNDEECQIECKYVMSFEAFDRVCIDFPNRGIRAVLPGGDLPDGSTIYVGIAASVFSLACEQEVSMQPCRNQNLVFFESFFDDIDDSYQRFSPGDTDTGVERTYTCRADATTDIGILLFNNEKCSTECLYTIPYSEFGNRCKENPGEQVSYFIPGQFTRSQRLIAGNVAQDFNLNCGGQLSIVNTDFDRVENDSRVKKEFQRGISHGLIPKWIYQPNGKNH